MNGEIYKMELDGRVVGKFGRAGKLPKEFGTVNAIDCRSDNELYVGEIGNWRVQKLRCIRNSDTASAAREARAAMKSARGACPKPPCTCAGVWRARRGRLAARAPFTPTAPRHPCTVHACP